MLPTIESIPVQIARRIKERRLALGWSRVRLANRAAVSVETLRAFERTGQVALHRLVRLAVVLGLRDEMEKLFATPPPPASLDDMLSQSKPRQRGR